MFDYIKGKLISAEPHKAVIETNGIGYLFFIPLSSFSSIGQIGSETLLYTKLVVKEDSHTLYGFLTRGEKELFEILLNISGIGPKSALSLVGHLDIDNFHAAIFNGDSRLICKVPGIGKKTAERLIIELKDKFKTGKQPLSHAIVSLKADDKVQDAINALIHLGYHPLQAQKAVKAGMTEECKDTSSLIKYALRHL